MRKKKAIINIISSVILQLITIICGFIIPKLIISKFGSNVNGLITSVTQFLAFITLLEAGFGPVIKSVLFKPIANKDATTISKIMKASEKIFRTISYIFIIYIALLCIILSLVLKNEFSAWYTISLIIIIAISTFAEYYFGMTYRLYLQAEQKTYVVSIIQVGTLLLNTIMVVVLIKLGCNIQIVKLSTTLIYVLRPILQNVYVKKKYNLNIKNANKKYKIQQKWDALAQHIAYVVHANTDVAILTLFGRLADISVYSVYLIVINSVKNIVQSFAGGIDSAFGDMIAKNENETLNKNFKIYEAGYYTIATIAFVSMAFLITPFVYVYTIGITDADYNKPIFAFLMVLAEFIFVIRQSYFDLVKVAGHFKQTRIGAYIEALVNIVVSFILVWKLGLIGVAIGTLVAMVVRTVELICYTSKHILQRSVWISFKNIIVIIVEVVVISIIMNFMPKFIFEVYSYGAWMLNAVIVGLISTVVVVIINSVIYRDSLKMILKKYITREGNL